MEPTPIELLRANHSKLQCLYEEFTAESARCPLQPIERLCLSLTELHYRIQLATFAAELAILVGLGDRATERLLKAALERRVSFDVLWSALLRHREAA